MKLWVIGFLTAAAVFADAGTKESPPPAQQEESVFTALAREGESNSSNSGESFAFRSFQFLKDHSVELGVELPLNLGIHGSVRLTDTTYIRLGAGYVYEKFLGVFSKVAPHFGYISEDEAFLMVDVLKNSVYLDGRIGWRPYAKSHEGGPYAELGISSMLFGKGEVDAHTVRGVLNTGDDIEKPYSIKSNVYNVTFHLGYQIPFAKNLRLNVDTGIIKVFYASPVQSHSTESIQKLPEGKHDSLRRLLVDKGWVFPTVSVWISFMF